MAANTHCASLEPEPACRRPDQGRFTGTVRPQQREDFARFNVKTDILQRFAFGKGTAGVPDFKYSSRHACFLYLLTIIGVDITPVGKRPTARQQLIRRSH
jgi:hypothetical protein